MINGVVKTARHIYQKYINPEPVAIEPLLSLFDRRHDKDLIVAEVGVFKADSSARMLKKWPIKEFYAVDRWANYHGYERGLPNVNDLTNYEQIFNTVCKRLSKYMDRVEIVEEDSSEAALWFSDNYFDFVFIDANHNYDYVKRDIDAWLPKVKLGGILAGHDYFIPGVCKAVDKYFKEYEIIETCWVVRKNK